jgi:phenylpyruvate tautomerase PptA (4-oxalocrotonate tautomerase family)
MKEPAMPVISVTLLPGYSRQAEERLVGRVAVAARSVIAASSAGTTVFVQHANTYQRDGQVFSVGGAERPDASAIVKDFLARMQARELDARVDRREQRVL